jgi:hypothetical protein
LFGSLKRQMAGSTAEDVLSEIRRIFAEIPDGRLQPLWPGVSGGGAPGLAIVCICICM